MRKATGPVHHKTITKEEARQYVKRTIEAIIRCVRNGFKVVCADASALENGSSDARGLRTVMGGKETVRVNFSKKTMKMMGAIGAGALYVHFCERASSDSLVALLDLIREIHDKVFVILDNARAHTSTTIREYLEGAGGRVVLWYLPPCTPRSSTTRSRCRGARSSGQSHAGALGAALTR